MNENDKYVVCLKNEENRTVSTFCCRKSFKCNTDELAVRLTFFECTGKGGGRRERAREGEG